MVRELTQVENQIKDAGSSSGSSNYVDELQKKKTTLLERIGSSVYSTQTLKRLNNQLNALHNQLRAVEEQRNQRISEYEQKKRLNDQTLVSTVNNLNACNRRLALYEQQVKEVELMIAYHVAITLAAQDL